MNKLIVAIFIFGFCFNAIASTEPIKPRAFAAIKTDRKDVRDVAEFAVSKINNGTMVKIISAKSQVVAGINYVLVLELETANGKHVQYGARVFVPLPVTKQPMQLLNAKILRHGNTTAPKNDPDYAPPVEPDSELFTD